MRVGSDRRERKHRTQGGWVAVLPVVDAHLPGLPARRIVSARADRIGGGGCVGCARRSLGGRGTRGSPVVGASKIHEVRTSVDLGYRFGRGDRRRPWGVAHGCGDGNRCPTHHWSGYWPRGRTAAVGVRLAGPAPARQAVATGRRDRLAGWLDSDVGLWHRR